MIMIRDGAVHQACHFYKLTFAENVNKNNRKIISVSCSENHFIVIN